ncbi:MAG TPA: imidazolonepropionase [Phototrophicaceae bacterium]|nr:imidazolonepropionase [Phototrophicaceae bacterium]
MTQRVDLLIYNAGQVCVVPSVAGGPQRGQALGTLGLVENGAVAVDDGKILEVGSSADLHAQYEAAREINAGGNAVIPGLVDPHTHLVWAGDRAAEFEQRLAGATYMDIMAAGGGINRTVRAVRAASVEQLIAETRARLDRMLRLGTTTVEIKTGYGLDIANEIKMLDAINRLAVDHPATIVPTFLGAHAVPAEFQGRTDDYVDLIVNEMIPAVAAYCHSHSQKPPFIDVFCEPDVFDVTQTRRILEAGRAHGMPLKIHADEFAGIGGTRLAVELGATSADHLVTTPEADIRALGQGNTVAVSLPATPFGLGHTHYTPARDIINAGGILALATDCNPGTAWCESMQFVLALACRYLKITPAEALAAATLNAAYAIGLGDTVGSLESGKLADILILSVPDYRHLAYRFGGNLIQIVIKAGNVVV